MSKFKDISGDLLAIANLPPEKRNSALSDLSVLIQGLPDYEIIQDQKDLISSIIQDLIAENDADQIAKSKLVFVEDVEEQIAPTKKTRAKKVVTPTAEVKSEDLPDFIEKLTLVKDLPEPVKKLIGLRRMQQAQTTSIALEDTIWEVLDWGDTPEGYQFWYNIHYEGDLREFKEKFGNKGEKVDELVMFAELNNFAEEFLNPEESAPAPAVKTRKPRTPKTPPAVKKQKLIFLRLIFYPPVGSAIKFELYNPTELYTLVVDILANLNVSELIFGFEAVTDFSSYLTNAKLYSYNSTNEMVDKLVEQFDTFVTPELDWTDFVKNGTDISRIKENNAIVNDAFKPKPKPKPVSVEKPKPVDKPKPVKVEKPKPVPVEKPKPVKSTPKPKVTKPKVEDDLSFLNDLDNIF